jgi:hypothetical protein
MLEGYRLKWLPILRPAVCVEVDRFGHLFGCQGAATIREAVTVEFSGDRRPMNPEAGRELLLRRTFFIGLDELNDLVCVQSALKLPRRAQAIGRSIIALTSEDGLETGHEQGVGVRTHHLHSRAPWSATQMR